MSAPWSMPDRIRAHWRHARLARKVSRLGKGSVFRPPGPVIVGGGRIEIADRVFGRPFIRLEAVESRNSPPEGPLIVIDEQVYLGFHVSVFATRRVEIGPHAYINGHVTIYDHFPPAERDEFRLAAKRGLAVGEVLIGERSWLGWGSVVLPGVRIGKHAVLGANSVAVRSIPDRSVAVGNPAVVVRRYDEALGAWRSVAPETRP